MNPKLKQAFMELAQLYSRNGQPTKALAMREKASSLAGSTSPDDIEEYIRNLQDANP
jgi:hypothetical protein